MQVGKSGAHTLFFLPDLTIVFLLLQFPYREANVETRARLTALTIPIKKNKLASTLEGSWPVTIEGISSTLSSTLRKYYRMRTRVFLKQTASHLQFNWFLVAFQLCTVRSAC